MNKLVLIFFLISSGVRIADAQVKLYEDQFPGGVTGGSFSTGVSGTGSGAITLHIDPASTIRKAYLIVGRLGPAPAFTVTLNTMSLTFDASNQATPDFNCPLYGGLSAVHAIDITSQVSPTVNTYNISYSQPGNGSNFFTDFYMYVAYQSNLLPLVSTVVYLKTLDYLVTEQYTLNLTYPVDTLVPIGFAMHAGYMCDNNADGENITVKGTLLGNIGGGDPGNPVGICSGTSGSFYYENNILTGLNGDFENQFMGSDDALSDVKMVLPNNATSFDVKFEHFGGMGSTADNSMWAWVMAYGYSNVQPTALFASPNHICPGTCTDFTNNSINATSFLWSFPGGVPSVSTDINPSTICYNTPGQYDVTLVATNANGSDTLELHNYITVYPYPAPQGISQSGDTLFANSGAVSYQWYHDGNLIQGATDYFYVAMEGGNYNVVATDANGCEVEAVIFDVVAGISFHSSKEHTVYPNPAKDFISVSTDGAALIQIVNVLGEVVLEASAESGQGNKIIRLTSLSPAMYWVRVIGNDRSGISRFMKY